MEELLCPIFWLMLDWPFGAGIGSASIVSPGTGQSSYGTSIEAW